MKLKYILLLAAVIAIIYLCIVCGLRARYVKMP